MIGQLALSVPLLLLLFYGWTEVGRSRAIGISMPLASITTLIFVWAPEEATQVARALELGSREDLILYSLIGLSLLVMLNLHLRNRRQVQVMTALTRQIALSGRPAIPGTAGRGSAHRPPVRAAAPAESRLIASSRGRLRQAEAQAAREHGAALKPRG